MKTKVIYHNADFDGIFCREIAKKFLGDTDVEYIGWNYGDRAPEIQLEDKLYILDLSIDELMLHPNLIWIDHHKTAIEKYPITIYGYRIDGVAACRLCWAWFSYLEDCDTAIKNFKSNPATALPNKDQYFDRIVNEPLSVQLAGEYDIWDKRNSNVDVFQFGLNSTDLDWKQLLSEDEVTCNFYVSLLLEKGQLLQQYQQSKDASAIKRGFTILWEGITFLALNTPRCNSLSFKAGIKSEHQALLGFYYDGTKWNISLYGIEGISPDLSIIAVKYGGGGHKQACGFNCKILPFIC